VEEALQGAVALAEEAHKEGAGAREAAWLTARLLELLQRHFAEGG
jgi:hypothetical protein